MAEAMTYRGHARAVLVLGLPLIGGHLGQIAIGVTDTVMLGWYAVEALAAVTLASTYFFTLFLLGSGFAMAVMPMVASYVAEDDDTSIRRATRMGMWLSLAFALLVMPALLRAEPILLLLGQDPQVAANAAHYLLWAGIGMIPALMVMVLKSYLTALERTTIILVVTIGMAILVALLLSQGAAGIPGGGFVIALIYVQAFNLPIEVAAIVGGIYRLVDMGNTTINVMGDLVGTSLVVASEERRSGVTS